MSGAAPPVGVLLCNLGTPTAPDRGAVRRFLAEFLADRRVVELPRWLWLPVLYGFILPLRPRRTAANYRKIWTAEGSPLLVISRRQAAALEDALRALLPHAVRLELGMRYGEPSIGGALQRLRAAGAGRIVVLPLYPQYSGSTTGSTFDAVAEALRSWRRVPELRFIADYHDDPGYIDALADSVRAYRAAHGAADRLLFSFHGIPQQYSDAGDPYRDQCLRTAQLTAARLGLADADWSVAFQSRFGPRPWLQPYTDVLLGELARGGCRRVQVICPGFAADCLETLEEIAIQNRALFLAAGGTEYSYIPALNDAPRHIAALAALLRRELQAA
jgi:ferrochelatase